jgi:hypothetical protein
VRQIHYGDIRKRSQSHDSLPEPNRIAIKVHPQVIEAEQVGVAGRDRTA